MRARLQSILIVRFHLLTFAIFLAFVDDRFMDRLKIMTFKRMAADVNVKVSCFRAVCTKTSPSSLHISFPRPVVHFLQRSPDEAGCEDRWGILSQSQVPDLTGVSVLSEFLVHTSWLKLQPPLGFSSVVSMCLASDILCWDADWFPQGICDVAQRSDRQLLWGLWVQVCIM